MGKHDATFALVDGGQNVRSERPGPATQPNHVSLISRFRRSCRFPLSGTSARASEPVQSWSTPSLTPLSNAISGTLVGFV
jgi:hypothetical protein